VLEREKKYQSFTIEDDYRIILRYKENETRKIARIFIYKNNYENELNYTLMKSKDSLQISSMERGISLVNDENVVVYRSLKRNEWETYFTKGIGATSWIQVYKGKEKRTKYVSYPKNSKMYRKFLNGCVIDVKDPSYVYDGEKDQLFVTPKSEKRKKKTSDQYLLQQYLLQKEEELRYANENFFPEIKSWTAYTEEELGLVAEHIEEQLEKKDQTKKSPKRKVIKRSVKN